MIALSLMANEALTPATSYKGYTGILGTEHGNSKRGVEGEQALIEAYLEVDGFEL